MYGSGFFRNRRHEAQSSAKALAPIILDLLNGKARSIDRHSSDISTFDDSSPIAVRSMIDVGCGDGSWVTTFIGEGVESYGIDGPWSPFENAIKIDLSCEILDQLEIRLPARVDFVLCLEFLEHLSPESGMRLLQWISSKTDVLVMSAAVPFQGGTGHVNEQWPDYWAKTMARLGFAACDVLRPMIWNEQSIAPWYRQNIIVYFKNAVPCWIQKVADENWRRASGDPLALVHPDLLSRKRSTQLLARFGL